jgi:hypothetical protein
MGRVGARAGVVSDWRVYRSRADAAKHARIRWESAEYRLSWGVQHFDGPHMRVIYGDGNGAGDGDYGVDLDVFFATHRPVSNREDHYLKVVKVRAYCTVESFTLTTQLKGTTEMVAVVPAGVFVVQNPGGEEYAMAPEEFERRYVPDE